jgi:hypothetical protein
MIHISCKPVPQGLASHLRALECGGVINAIFCKAVRGCEMQELTNDAEPSRRVGGRAENVSLAKLQASYADYKVPDNLPANAAPPMPGDPLTAQPLALSLARMRLDSRFIPKRR